MPGTIKDALEGLGLISNVMEEKRRQVLVLLYDEEFNKKALNKAFSDFCKEAKNDKSNYSRIIGSLTYYAAQTGNLYVIKKIKESGGNLEIGRTFERSNIKITTFPAGVAAQEGRRDVIRLLSELGSNIFKGRQTSNEVRTSTAYIAAKHGKADVIKTLGNLMQDVDFGSEINSSKTTPIYTALKHRSNALKSKDHTLAKVYKDTIKALINARASVIHGFESREGESLHQISPLYVAVENNDEEIVRMLLKGELLKDGSNIIFGKLKDGVRTSPLALAKELGYTQIEQMLESQMPTPKTAQQKHEENNRIKEQQAKEAKLAKEEAEKEAKRKVEEERLNEVKKINDELKELDDLIAIKAVKLKRLERAVKDHKQDDKSRVDKRKKDLVQSKDNLETLKNERRELKKKLNNLQKKSEREPQEKEEQNRLKQESINKENELRAQRRREERAKRKEAAKRAKAQQGKLKAAKDAQYQEEESKESTAFPDEDSLSGLDIGDIQLDIVSSSTATSSFPPKTYNSYISDLGFNCFSKDERGLKNYSNSKLKKELNELRKDCHFQFINFATSQATKFIVGKYPNGDYAHEELEAKINQYKSTTYLFVNYLIGDWNNNPFHGKAHGANVDGSLKQNVLKFRNIKTLFENFDSEYVSISDVSVQLLKTKDHIPKSFDKSILHDEYVPRTEEHVPSFERRQYDPLSLAFNTIINIKESKNKKSIEKLLFQELYTYITKKIEDLYDALDLEDNDDAFEILEGNKDFNILSSATNYLLTKEFEKINLPSIDQGLLEEFALSDEMKYFVENNVPDKDKGAVLQCLNECKEKRSHEDSMDEEKTIDPDQPRNSPSSSSATKAQSSSLSRI